MNTKVVYVLTSTEEDIYLFQTMLSAFSLRRKTPSVEIELIVDKKTDSTIVGNRKQILNYIDNKIVVDVPEKYDKKQSSRYLKTSLREIVKGDFLFLDSDTIIAEDISEIDTLNVNIGMVLDVHTPINFNEIRARKLLSVIDLYEKDKGEVIPYYNSGIIFSRDNKVAHDFYNKWHELWDDVLFKCEFHYDQPSLAVANALLSYPISELEGIWNCQIMNSGLAFLFHAKIIHYFATANQIKTTKDADKAYLFYDKTIFDNIKRNGITAEIADLVDNAKGAFKTPCRIVVGNELQLLSNSLHYTAIRHPRTYSCLNKLAKKLNGFYEKIGV